MKKSIIIVLSAILACVLILTGCNTGVEKKTNDDIEAPTNEKGDVVTEIITLATSPYVNVTDANGNCVTEIVVNDDGSSEVYYEQMAREDVEKAANGESVETQKVEVKTNNSVGTDSGAIVKEFLDIMGSGKFALTGSITTDGDTVPVDFMAFDDNATMATTFEGVTLKIGIIDGQTYLIDDARKSYMELSSTVQKILGVDGEDLVGLLDGFSSDTIDTENVTTNTEAIDGVLYDVYECFEEGNPTSSTKFFIEDGKVTKMLMYENGTLTSELIVNEIRGNLTKDEVMLPSDYTKSGYIEFIGNLAENMQ